MCSCISHGTSRLLLPFSSFTQSRSPSKWDWTVWCLTSLAYFNNDGLQSHEIHLLVWFGSTSNTIRRRDKKNPSDRIKWESVGDSIVEHANRLVRVALKAQSSFINVLMKSKEVCLLLTSENKLQCPTGCQWQGLRRNAGTVFFGSFNSQLYYTFPISHFPLCGFDVIISLK